MGTVLAKKDYRVLEKNLQKTSESNPSSKSILERNPYAFVSEKRLVDSSFVSSTLEHAQQESENSTARY
jgi:hypothetical protein